jgi:Amino acid permease
MAREKHHPDPAAGPPPGADAASIKGKAFVTPGRVLVVTSVMLTFISAWRVAAIVLCDLAGTAYYIGGIVESQIGKAAPWFILAVMLFSYAVRSVYIESCSMFVRGGVYPLGHGRTCSACSKLAFASQSRLNEVNGVSYL